MAERFDVAVIGTGPAGISAAITLKIRNKSILLIGSEQVSEKVRKAHEINNYPGLPGITGEELSQRLLNHAGSMGIDIVTERVTAVYAMGNYYSLQTGKNDFLEAKTVILATGADFGGAYPGEKEFLGRGVSYCATCDAPLYVGKKVAVIGFGKEAAAEARFLAEKCSEVIYIPADAQAANGDETGLTVIKELPVAIAGNFKAEKVIFDKTELAVDGIFILRESIAPSNLVPGLETENNAVKVSSKMETNLPGLFACGDVAGAPFQYIKAAGEGNVAALSAVNYLSMNKL